MKSLVRGLGSSDVAVEELCQAGLPLPRSWILCVAVFVEQLLPYIKFRVVGLLGLADWARLAILQIG